MIKNILLSACFLVGFSSVLFSQTEVSFASYPALSPDGSFIVFSYDGDLWRVSSKGGQAYRLTAMPGNEIAPRISPDGKWLAFSSDQNGNQDVFVMPLSGGEIRQLTYHSQADVVDSWGWDSKTIYFTSSRANRFTSYKVSREGGSPRRVFGHYFNTIHDIAEKPDGTLLFNDSWESYTAASRKRYKGPFNPDILSYNEKTKEFKQLTHYDGKDFWPSTDRNGTVYFASDEENGEYNLYTFIDDKKTALTSFDTSIKRPVVSADGSKVVFEKKYQIYLYDVASGTTSKPGIYVGRNQVLDKENLYDVKGKISYFDISPDGKKLAFISRGELFVSDIKGKFIRKMPGDGERIMEVKWLADNKTLLFNKTYKGYPNWFVTDAGGKGSVKQLTKDLQSNRDMSFNFDGSTGVYLSGRNEVRLMDLKTFKSRTLVEDEVWAFQSSKPSFSPDGNYVLYTARRNFEQDIFVYDLRKKKSYNLTNTGVSEEGPYWSPDGKYIYFASNRTRPSYPRGMQNSSIYRLALENFDEPYRSDSFENLFSETSDSEKNKKKEKNQKVPVVRIDFENLADRVERVSSSFGTQNNPVVFITDSTTRVLYFSNENEQKPALYQTVYKDFEKKKTEKIADGRLQNILRSGKEFYVLHKGTVNKLNLNSKKLEPVAISFSLYRNHKQEFRQMFEETWAGIDENFYDGEFHGVDWDAVRKQYEAYLPALNTRADLRVLLNDMLGELNSSHLGFNTKGPEEKPVFKTETNEIGVVFEDENPFQIARIVAKSPASKKGVNLQKGDILLAVNGEKVNPEKNRERYFSFPELQDELQLTVLRGGTEIQTRVHPQKNNDFKNLLYDEWIENNRNKVQTLSDNRIAYSHMKNMTAPELERFLLDMVRYENNTEATILDLRYNTGGNVHDDVLRFLSQKPYLQWKYRDGKVAPQSNFAPAGKPIILLINQQSLSDAEMTAAGFKALNLGKIIGTSTYRWIIFTSSKSLVDGSTFRVPAWGCYTLEGENLELTGVDPDLVVEKTFQDKIEGNDPQLERAVQEILKEIRQ